MAQSSVQSRPRGCDGPEAEGGGTGPRASGTWRILEQLAATEEELRNNYEQLTLLEGDLRKSHELYRGVVEDQTELICRFRPDGTIVFANNAYCRYFNTSQKEITGRIFRPEVFVDERDQVRETFLSLTPDNPVASVDQRTVLPDGTIRWQHWVDRALFDGNGILVEYQSVGRDITDVKDGGA